MKKCISTILIILTVLAITVALGISVFAQLSAPDAMDDILSGLAVESDSTKNYLVGDPIDADDGGFVGSVVLYTFFDEENFDITPGYHGTPIIFYTVNTGVSRIGVKSDVEIIKSMLERGYAVIVADYLNSPLAVSPLLDNSASMMRSKLRAGEYLGASCFPEGDYYEIHLCPAGYDVLPDQIFWSADKHGVDGTLDKIVEIWNNDFRNVTSKGKQLVIWATGDTVNTRKTVTTASDGSEPVWYNSDGVRDDEGLYTLVKYTYANSILDCVDPDGSPLSLDMYVHVVYPTVDEDSEAVPVFVHAASSTYPTTSVTVDVDRLDRRAHAGGFLFNGYAQVVYDYLYVPMARGESWGYFFGTDFRRCGYRR